MYKPIAVLSCAVVLFSACGNNEDNNVSTNNTNANNTLANNTTPNNAMANNTTGSNNMTTPPMNNMTTPVNNTNPGGEVTETEPNDSVATATLFNANDTLKGGVGDMDNDFWKIQLQGGSVLEVEIVAMPRPLEMYVDLVEDAQNVPDRTLDGDLGTKRQFFIPLTGSYTLQLIDTSSENANYEIATRVLAPNPVGGLNVPGSIDGDLNDYAIDIYTYSAGEDASVRAEVTSDRTPNNTDMDGILMIYDPAGGLVAVNDDVDSMTVDPGVMYDQVSGKTYWVVIDAYSMDVMGPNTYTYASELQ